MTNLFETLARTTTHVVEWEDNSLSIIRADGQAVVFRGHRGRKDFTSCLETHTPQQVIDTFIRCGGLDPWVPLYKRSAMAKKLLST